MNIARSSIRPLDSSQSGSALIVALTALAVLAPLVAITVASTSSRGTLAQRDRDWTIANEACDSSMEFAFASWKAWIQANGGVVPLAQHLPTQAANGTQTAGSTYDGRTALSMPISTVQGYFDATKKFNGVKVNRLEIQVLDASGQPIANNTGLTATAQRSAMRAVLPLEKRPRLKGSAYTYLITAECEKSSRGKDGKVTVRSQRYMRKTDASIWQAMMFFDNDIELFPTPAMEINGWLHTNSNGYLCHADNSNDLKIDGDFTFKGNTSTISKGTNATLQDPDGLIYGTSYLQALRESGWNNFKAPVWNGGGYSDQVEQVTEKIEPFSQPSSSIINTTDASANNDSLREIIERPVDTNADGKRTSADDTTEFATRRFYNMADVKIIVNRAAAAVGDRIKVLDKNDNVLTTTFATDVATKALKKDATTGLPSTKDFYDYREAGNITSTSASSTAVTSGKVTVTNIDMSQLTTLLNGYTDYTNGVVYFKDETPAGTASVNDKHAVRLQRGGTLPDIGLTFVTEDGAYVQGDYNTGSTYADASAVSPSVDPDSNNGTTPNPTQNKVGTYEVKPSAVCADAVMFLSNAWQDSYGSGTATTGRKASATTYNTAFMSGDVPTNTAYQGNTSLPDTRSGGGINFPRVLEDWASNCLTYWGSMVQLYNSKVFNTTWNQYIYQAPGRPWNFENLFLTNPPPGPFEFVEYTRGRFVRPLN
jgi:hypothetical protein